MRGDLGCAAWAIPNRTAANKVQKFGMTIPRPADNLTRVRIANHQPIADANALAGEQLLRLPLELVLSGKTEAGRALQTVRV